MLVPSRCGRCLPATDAPLAVVFTPTPSPTNLTATPHPPPPPTLPPRSQTGAPLELPSVHFLCGHSFNLRTLGDSDSPPQCPLCAAEQRKTQDLLRR